MTSRNSANAENAGFGSKNQTSEASVDVEREPMPDRTPDTNLDNPEVPPARSGSVSEHKEKPTEGASDNPVRHNGHVPPPVTANRE
jgi:hypothetical protein